MALLSWLLRATLGGRIIRLTPRRPTTPFIITVGASEEGGTPDRNNDWVADFTQHGITQDGYQKPEVIAPGKDIVSVLAASSWWQSDYPERYVDGGYFRISGTSMAAPMVSGAAASRTKSNAGSGEIPPDEHR